MRLNRSNVEKIKSLAVERVVMDTDVPNFGLRVMPSGVKTYFVRYRVGTGRRAPLRRMTLGRHPSMTPEKARQRARDIMAEARLGADPAVRSRAGAAEKTVAELIHEWAVGPGLKDRRGELRKAQNVAFDVSRLVHHVEPIIGKLPLSKVTRQDIERTRDAIEKGKTAKVVKTRLRGVARVTGGAGAATRVLRTLGSVFSYAVDRGWIQSNPVRGVRKRPDNRSERFLSPEELGRLECALRSVEIRHPQAVAILRLLLLTGCRKREIEALRWSEVDLARGFLRLKHTKTGSRVVFLAQAAVEVIKRQPQVADCDWVFPGAGGRSFYQHMPQVWRQVRAAAGLEGVRIHDLRHTYASTAIAAGVSLEYTAALLGHRERRTTERYAHLAAEAVREAGERSASHLLAAMNGPIPPSASTSAVP